MPEHAWVSDLVCADDAVLGCGYRHGMREPSREFSFEARVPPLVRLSELDEWLIRAFRVRRDDLARRKDGELQSQEQRLCVLTDRAVLLGGALFRAARQPVFERGRVLCIGPSADGVHSVNLAVPIPAGLERSRIVESVFGWSLRIVFDNAEGIMSSELLERLYEDLGERLLLPLWSRLDTRGGVVHVLDAVARSGKPWFGLGSGMFQIGWGCNQLRVDGSSVDSDSFIGARRSHNKIAAAQLMREAGLPVPEHEVAVSPETAQGVARRLGWPVVVKPADRDRGEGVSVGVDQPYALLKAFKQAASLSRVVLVEQQVEGICHRVFIVRGTVLFVTKRLPKCVSGDGRRSIRELVSAQNRAEMLKPRWERAKPWPFDDETLRCLSDAGFGPETVLGEGERAFLRKFQSAEWGGEAEDYSGRIHPDNVDIAVRAVALFGFDVAGVDIISPDISMAWHENGARINEINVAPLIGGSPVSLQALPRYLDLLVPADGRIPVHVYVGAERAWDDALRQQRESSAVGQLFHLTSGRVTLRPDGSEVRFAVEGLFARCSALLRDREVCGLIVVAQDEELLVRGLPFDRIDRLDACDARGDLPGHGRVVSRFAWSALVRLLTEHLVVPAVSGEDRNV